jgi:acyl-CoA dehydrogenase
MTRSDAALLGGVLHTAAPNNNLADLRALADELGVRAFEARLGQHRRPERFDAMLWQNLEETGLTRLTSTADLDAGPADLAVVLHRLAHHAGAVPIAETDLLAAYLGQQAALELPSSGPMTIAIADAVAHTDTVVGTATGVPWTRIAGAVVLVACTSAGAHVTAVDPSETIIVDDHNLAGEPRDRITFKIPLERLVPLENATYEELIVRGAWARCVQVIGALDAAATLSAAHCRERIQFGKPLSDFQAVQHSLARMAGEIERARATAELAVAAASAHGFGSAQTAYAVTVAKTVLGRVSNTATTTAHQLHGAIGVSIEHPLWLSTTRAQSWISEFGSTRYYARKLGRSTLRANDPWAVLTGEDTADSRPGTADIRAIC